MLGEERSLCNELNVPVVLMVVAFNLKEHRHTRGRHHKIVSFYMYSEGLKFETIFRNNFILES